MRTIVVLWRTLTAERHIAGLSYGTPYPGGWHLGQRRNVELIGKTSSLLNRFRRLAFSSSANSSEKRRAPFVGRIHLSPSARQFAGDGGLEQRAAPSVEAGARPLQRSLAFGN